MLTRNLISFSFEPDGFLSFECLEMSYRNFPKSTILHTGGFAVGATSTKSWPRLCALRKASVKRMTPSCSPEDAIMTRTSRARIRPFTRICGCRLDQSPQQRNGSAPRHRLVFIAIYSVRIRKRQALFLRHGCDSPHEVLTLPSQAERSCRQQFR